jgi:hypothetical protein
MSRSARARFSSRRSRAFSAAKSAGDGALAVIEVVGVVGH